MELEILDLSLAVRVCCVHQISMSRPRDRPQYLFSPLLSPRCRCRPANGARVRHNGTQDRRPPNNNGLAAVVVFGFISRCWMDPEEPQSEAAIACLVLRYCSSVGSMSWLQLSTFTSMKNYKKKQAVAVPAGVDQALGESPAWCYRRCRKEKEDIQ